jgi:hypothetical protein
MDDRAWRSTLESDNLWPHLLIVAEKRKGRNWNILKRQWWRVETSGAQRNRRQRNRRNMNGNNDLERSAKVVSD